MKDAKDAADEQLENLAREVAEIQGLRRLHDAIVIALDAAKREGEHDIAAVLDFLYGAMIIDRTTALKELAHVAMRAEKQHPGLQGKNRPPNFRVEVTRAISRVGPPHGEDVDALADRLLGWLIEWNPIQNPPSHYWEPDEPEPPSDRSLILAHIPQRLIVGGRVFIPAENNPHRTGRIAAEGRAVVPLRRL